MADITVTVPASMAERAARLAEVLTADPVTTDPDDQPWTVQDVIIVALGRGLVAMEELHLKTARP
jgi:hypothetical protein